ncbi:Rne/Rng family ribonuclease [Bacillus sp. 2205SS5-2]|uniref:Rne/Rng family ribonuclease n=1 Tax=Bacillus sp. 2205SS5-2 TaxID=3109031 RepID=UPI00300712E9
MIIIQHLLINAKAREKRWALIEDGNLFDWGFNRDEEQSLVGHIYYGIVTKVVPGLNAAFIDFGGNKQGFLYRDETIAYVQSTLSDREKKALTIGKCVHQGEKVIVQVKKDGTETKGPKLSMIVEWSGEKAVYMPHGRYIAVSKKGSNVEREDWREKAESWKSEEEGMIIRTGAFNVSEDLVLEELTVLKAQSQQAVANLSTKKPPILLYKQDVFMRSIIEMIRKHPGVHVICDDQMLLNKLKNKDLLSSCTYEWYQGNENIFATFGIESDLLKLLKKIVWLENGAYIIIEKTEAMTIIDVNTGKFTGKDGLANTVFKTNKWAAKEIAKQILLRNLSGIILIDFIDMKDENQRSEISKTLKIALVQDPLHTRIIGFTELGILQLTRKKTSQDIGDSYTSTCPTCTGMGVIVSAETVAYRMERELWEYERNESTTIKVETTKEVKKFFCGEKDAHLHRIQGSLGKKVVFSLVESDVPAYSIIRSSDERDDELKS